MEGTKRIFLAYRFTGEEIEGLTITLGKILSTLRQAGHTVYCSIEDEQSFRRNGIKNVAILRYAFERLDESDMVLAFVSSDLRSEGMLMEIGYALAKGKRIAVAMKKGVKSPLLPHLADPLIEFEFIDDLCGKLANIKF